MKALEASKKDPRVRVLAVDDEQMNLGLLRRALRRSYDVITAQSPAEALEILETTPDVGIIVSDYRMPGMNGAEFLAESMKTHPSAVRVMITGYADGDNVIEAINSGRVDFLLKKPFSHRELGEVLEKLLSEKRRGEGSTIAEPLSYRDPLTKLYNHRHFHERLAEELSRAQRYGQKLSVIIGDIDKFSDLNAEIGYELGDETLRRIADLFRSSESSARVRDSDIVARLGGEEFAFLLPETTKEGAAIKANRLRAAIEAHEFPEKRAVTLSFGVAGFPDDGGSGQEVLQHACDALRAAKSAGRNCIHVFGKEQGSQDEPDDDLDIDDAPTTIRQLSSFIRPDRFRSYHSRISEIIDALDRDRSLSCLYVDLSHMRRIEQQFGFAQHAEVFARAGELLEKIKGEKLRKEDMLCRTEDADAYLCFLSPPRNPDTEPLDLEGIAARVQNVLERGLGDEVESMIRDRPRVIVGFARVLKNSMLRPERHVIRLIGEAQRSASLHRERLAQHNKALLQEVILRHELTAVYQPIVHLQSGETFGYESLIRGPRNSTLESPAALFSVADEVNLTFELDRACFRSALTGAVGISPVHRLFVNLLPPSFYDSGFIENEVLRLLGEASITPANIVFEITEKLAIEDFSAFRRALARYTDMGFGVAIDDVGTRHSNLETVMALRPHFIKISDVLARGVAQSMVKREMLRSLQRIAETIDAVLVAEGIETVADLAVLSDLGVRYGQGFFLARPGAPFPKLRSTTQRTVRALATQSREALQQIAARTPPSGDFASTQRVTRVRLDGETDELPTGALVTGQIETPSRLRASGSGASEVLDPDSESEGTDSTEENWEPLSAEDLGVSTEDSPLISSLRRSRGSVDSFDEETTSGGGIL